MNSQAPCPFCDDGVIPVSIAPAEMDVGIMGPYLDDWGDCELCGRSPDEDDEDAIRRLEEQAIEYLDEHTRYPEPYDLENDR